MLNLSAQASPGSVSGTVSDTNRIPVQGATIQLKNVATQTVYRAVSNPAGAYTISQLPPGNYELSASSFGFKTYERNDVVIQSGQTLRIDIPIGDFISLDTLGEDRATIGRLVLSRAQPPAGPAPRTADGKPDFSGIWYGPLPSGEATPELLPAAQAIAKARMENNFKDAPNAHCLPFNVAVMNAFFLNRLVQTQGMLAVILEYDIPGYRQIYLDGRPHPKDLEPSWTGHSIGTWDGDTLIIETVGFNDKTWLGESAPHTDRLKVTTRLKRPDLGHLEIETTFEDPGVLTKPWVTKGVATLAPASEEIHEFICNENNQDVEHLVGK
jgi:hypothetical protein